MPKQGWSGGTVKVDTADKKHLVKAPQQQHNLAMAPNRCVLLTGPPNAGKSATSVLTAAGAALKGTEG